MNFFNRSQTANYDQLDVSGYRSQFYDTKSTHTLVDVRTTGEFAQGHLPNAVNIPLNEIKNRTDEIPADHPVVVVCASGNRSRSGCSVLKSAGFKDVYNLKGGTFAWMTSGLPLE